MTSMTELLPCPFCGGEATVERIGKSGYFYVACNTAYCCDFGKFDTEAEAIVAWNTRDELGSEREKALEELVRDAYWLIVRAAWTHVSQDKFAADWTDRVSVLGIEVD